MRRVIEKKSVVDDPCPQCLGSGYNPFPIPCGFCKGSGHNPFGRLFPKLDWVEKILFYVIGTVMLFFLVNYFWITVGIIAVVIVIIVLFIKIKKYFDG